MYYLVFNKCLLHTYVFVGIWPNGPFGRTFVKPRYIITIPPFAGVYKGTLGLNVMVLDNKALHYFKANGNSKWEDGTVLLKGKVKKCRGLAFVEKDTVVTTENTPTGVDLVFIDINFKRMIVKRFVVKTINVIC